ncbi:MAG: SGNH hydrolase domain-containing protein [Nocardioidaceae bacterium]
MTIRTDIEAPVVPAQHRASGTTTLPRPAPVADPTLPSPPTDEEKYWYLGPQRRWLLALQAVSFALIAYSVARFATADVRLILFLVPMTLYAVTLVVSLLSGTRRRRFDRADHDRRVKLWSPAVMPSATVMLPSAGEPLDILRNTYGYVSRLRWRGELDVLVLDDSDRPEVADLAAEHGFRYLVRPNRGYLKKAGNLRFGYEHSDGDLIVILDADFVPRPDFLTELAPYFDDPDVGIVQSPQFYDTRRKGMGWLERSAGATQELFYRLIQPSRDRVGAAICVGTCAVYRRAALQQAGGFAQIGHSEDVHTGVKLMKVGFRVQYVPVLVSKGLCPDSVSAFLNQQYRWCSGSMALLRDKEFHETPALTTKQRLSFWAGFLYYISTAVNAVVAPLPALAMVWLLPAWVEPMNSIWLVGALALWFVILPAVMKGKWRIQVLRVQHLYSFAHLTAIRHILTNGTREWVATGAVSSGTPLATSIGRTVRWYVLATQLLLWAGLARGIQLYGIDQYWAMVVLAVVAAYIQVPLVFLRTGVKHVRGSRRAAVARLGRRLRPSRIVRPRGIAVPAQQAAHPDTLSAPQGLESSPGPRRFRPDIQGLRAVAILAVVLYHAHVPFVTGGYVGVDVFFVISGFLISGQLLRQVEKTGRISFVGFYAGRMRRLLPPLVIVVLATAAAARLWDSIFHVRSVLTDALFTLVYGMNYRLAAVGADYQNANGPVSPLQHMWSLAVEEQFYLVWPLLLGLAAWVGRRHLKMVVGLVLAAGIGVSLWFSITDTESNPILAYFSLHTRLWQFAVGAMVALVAARLSRLPAAVAVPASWLGLAGVLLGVFVYDENTPFPGTAALLPTLATALVIAAGCRQTSMGAERLLDLRPAQAIGLYSYGWYLWHWPMVILIPLAVNADLGWVMLLEVSALALWFAVLTQHLVENPTRRSRMAVRRWLGLGTGASVVTGALVVALGITMPAFVGTGASVAASTLRSGDLRQLQHTLTKAAAMEEAPKNLRPAVGEAVSDQPASTRDGCHADYTQVEQDDCVYGDPNGQKTLALYGDSHAQQWLPALDALGKKLHWKVVSWTKAACPIADVPVYNDTLGREFTECEQWRTLTAERVENLNPDKVIVSQSDAVIGDQVSDVDWADGTAQAVARLRAAGLDVEYLSDTPPLPYGAGPECVATHLDDVSACAVPVKDTEVFKNRRARLDDALHQVGIPVVDTQDLICGSEVCPMIVENMLVYRDIGHITATYSEWLSPLLEFLFRPTAQAPSDSP